jgi:two-component system OmpR family response regulator
MLHAPLTMDLSTRLLVVDDDPGIRELTAAFLSGHGYVVDAAEHGEAMRAALSREAYALVVLDVMMPGEDGLTILRSLDPATAPPVIIVSAIGGDVDRIVGLEMGADDYLPKPANPRELLARVRSVLRRRGEPRAAIASVAPAAPAPPEWHFAGWRLKPVSRELFDADDVLVNLSDGEFRLLITLVEHPRRVLTRDFMLEQSRGIDAEHFDRAIDVQVSRLRRKLARHDGSGDELIRTVRNEGYMFTADVERR